MKNEIKNDEIKLMFLLMNWHQDNQNNDDGKEQIKPMILIKTKTDLHSSLLESIFLSFIKEICFCTA